jgi:FG-GAP repeat
MTVVKGARARVGGAGVSRRLLYRRSKRVLMRPLAARWRGPRRALEGAVRRFLAPLSRRELSSLLGDRRLVLAAAAALTASMTALGLPPVNLADVAAGNGGFVINGINAYDRSGTSVSGAGDVNGDGLADVVVGAVTAYANDHDQTGQTYVIFGKADGTPVNLFDVVAGTGGFVINGAFAYDQSGSSV